MPGSVSVSSVAGGVAVITIKREPVNSMSREVWRDLRTAVEQVEAEAAANGTKAMVIRSGLDRDVFTAGNDLMELYAPATSEARFKQFWSEQTSALLAVYMSPLTTVAAVKGACPAGGCVLALCCDYVVATENATLGLNEVALGIAVPRYWGVLLGQTVGPRRAERYCCTAALIGAKQAHADGFVTELVPSADGLTDAACTLASKLGKFGGTPGFAATKASLREQLATDWARYAAREEPETAWAGMSEPERVKQMGELLQRMSKGGKKRGAGAATSKL